MQAVGLAHIQEIPLLVRFLEPHRDRATAYLRSQLGKAKPQRVDAGLQNGEVPSADACVKLVLILIRLGDHDRLWPRLHNLPDPTVRSLLIEHLATAGVPPGLLLQRVEIHPVASVRSALLLALGEYEADEVLQDDADPNVALVEHIYRTDPTSGVHSAAEWLLRKWVDKQRLQDLRDELKSVDDPQERRWYVNSVGQCMAILDRATFWMGADPAERETNEESLPSHQRYVDRSVAISTTEVTLDQFLDLLPHHKKRHDSEVGPESNCPVNMVSHDQAMEYCQRLSKREGIPEDQWCYKYVEVDGAPQIVPREEFVSLGGYRLPTEGEWEMACRAGTVTSRFTGNDERLITRYGWCSDNAQRKTWPVGSLRPNPWGFFDMYGNLFEFCQDRKYEIADTDGVVDDVLHYGPETFVVMKGHYYGAAPRSIASHFRSRTMARGERTVGFRIARFHR
jgi:formylglycine-generating enzyme required for sulfatase activity